MMRLIVLILVFLSYTGEVMSQVSEYSSKIEYLHNVVTKPSKNGRCREKLLRLQSKLNLLIPDEVCNLIEASKLVNSELEGLFLGHELLNESYIASQYDNLSSPSSFFSNYEVDDKFNVGFDMEVALEDDRFQELEPSHEIHNIKPFLPLFKFQSDYVVFNLSEDSYSGLVVITHGHLGNVLAPSIIDHLEDLSGGLAEGKYRIVDGELIYPSSWYLRKKVRSGELIMDEYGDVE